MAQYRSGAEAELFPNEKIRDKLALLKIGVLHVLLEIQGSGLPPSAYVRVLLRQKRGFGLRTRVLQGFSIGTQLKRVFVGIGGLSRVVAKRSTTSERRSGAEG